MNDITPEKVRELLDAANPRGWKLRTWRGREMVMAKNGCLWNPDNGQINFPADAALIAAAPAIAQAYLDLLDRIEAEKKAQAWDEGQGL